MSLLLIVDIDGTIADATERFKNAGPEPLRHDKEAYSLWVSLVNSGLEADKPVKGMASLITILGCMGLADVVYCTSREETLREATEQWLFHNKFPVYPLYMRPQYNLEEADVLKEHLILKAKYTFRADEVIVIDDDQKGTIEKMCHKNGYTFLKATSGGK